MPSLKANALAVKAAINGPRASLTIEGHPRLYLEVKGGGRATWNIRYRIDGRQREHTLHSDAKNATFSDIIRAKNEWLMRLQTANADPKAELELRRKRDGRNLGSTFEEWITYTGKGRKRALARRTAEGYRGLYDLHIAPALGHVALEALTKADVAGAVEKARRASAKSKKGGRGLQGTKVLKLLSSICEWSIDREYIEKNPCRSIEEPVPERNPLGKGTRNLTNDELRIVWNEGPEHMGKAVTRVLRLTILLGRRISELALARREDVRLDLPFPCLVIPADREGNKSKREDAVPLPPLALGIVKEALAEGDEDGALFVGATTRWTTSHAFTAFRRDQGWSGRTRLHDMRGLINDGLAAAGVHGEMRSRILHHTNDLKALSQTTYSSYEYLAEKLEALKLWEARVLAIVEPKRAGLATSFKGSQ